MTPTPPLSQPPISSRDAVEWAKTALLMLDQARYHLSQTNAADLHLRKAMESMMLAMDALTRAQGATDA